MKSLLHILEGLSVTEVKEVHDYIQLLFGKEIGLSIYNDRFLIPRTTKLSDLVGKIITSIAENKDSVSLKFIDGTQLTIDMRDQAYHGPEALQLNYPGMPTIIQN
jgi:hypothetical protein